MAGYSEVAPNIFALDKESVVPACNMVTMRNLCRPYSVFKNLLMVAFLNLLYLSSIVFKLKSYLI